MSREGQQLSYWNPDELWVGKQVVILGGGPSLKRVNLGLLRSTFSEKERIIIGLNDAYLLDSIVDLDVVFWGDNVWLEHHRKFLNAAGPAFAKITCQSTQPLAVDNVLWVQRRPDGLWKKGRIGWNWSTGAAAINLALLMGSKEIVLLGFDMKDEEGMNNWHPNLINPPPNKKLRELQFSGFATVAKELPEKFPEARVYNATEGTSLKCFNLVRLEDVL